MSWDIIVQDFPAAAMSIAEIPDDFQPKPLGCSRASIITSILKAAPFADVSDPGWIRIAGHGIDVEVSLGNGESVEYFAFHTHGGDLSVGFVATVLQDLGLRALDPQSETGIFDAKTAANSFSGWAAYRDEVGGK